MVFDKPKKAENTKIIEKVPHSVPEYKEWLNTYIKTAVLLLSIIFIQSHTLFSQSQTLFSQDNTLFS